MDHDIKKTLAEILSSVKSLEKRVENIESGSNKMVINSQHTTPPVEKKMSIKEFIISRQPKNGVQMTLTIAYYLETIAGISPLNAADLEKGFRSAREVVPQNINDKTNMCVSNGHLQEAEQKKDSMKAWVVTRSGEEMIQRGFGNTSL